MRCNYLAALAVSVSWILSSAALAVPPVNDVCDTGAIVIDQSTCAPSTDIGNCAKSKSSWCSPLGVDCGGADGLCIPIVDDMNVQSVNQFDCDIVPTDNREATSGYPISTNDPNCSDSFFGSDIWWTIVAPCSGLMDVTMCGGGEYDAMLATYDFCPNPNETVIVVPISCNDDGCGVPSGLSQLEPFAVSSGQEVIVRVGGWAGDTSGAIMPAAEGQSQMHVRFVCFAVDSAPVTTLSGEPGFSKNRYVSFDPNTNGTDAVAIRVTRVGGIDEYVDCTQVVDKGADGFYAKLIDGPLPPPGDSIYYCDWSSVTTGLHVTSCNVLPGNLYEVSTTIDGDNFSPLIAIETTTPQFSAGREMGDLVGGLVGGFWTAPDGLFTTSDVVAMISAGNMEPTAPMLARVDLVGESQIGGALLVPDAIISQVDIDQFNAVFSGQPFGFGVTNCLTGTCIPPVNCSTGGTFPEAPFALSGEHGYTKDRYVSIDPTSNGSTPVAIRVTRVGGTDKYLDCTSLTFRGSDGLYAKLIDGPLPAAGDATYYCNLGGPTAGLHMRGCSIMPGNIYDISMTIDGTVFSSALPISTTLPQFTAGRSYGDLGGTFVGGVWTAPDGLVTASDIVAVVQKFSLVLGAPILARTDTEGAIPNGIQNGADMLRAVTGFAGSSFGFGVTDCLTGICVPPQGGACE